MDEQRFAAGVRKTISGLEDMLAALEATPPPNDEQPTLLERQIAVCQRFDVTPENGLNRRDASRAFSDNGISPRAAGSWTQHGWIIREGDRRWLSDMCRDWVRDQLAELAARQHERAV